MENQSSNDAAPTKKKPRRARLTDVDVIRCNIEDCPTKSKGYVHKGEYDRHVRRVHENMLEEETIQILFEAVESGSAGRKAAGEEKPYVCPCGFKAKRLRKVKDHILGIGSETAAVKHRKWAAELRPRNPADSPSAGDVDVDNETATAQESKMTSTGNDEMDGGPIELIDLLACFGHTTASDEVQQSSLPSEAERKNLARSQRDGVVAIVKRIMKVANLSWESLESHERELLKEIKRGRRAEDFI